MTVSLPPCDPTRQVVEEFIRTSVGVGGEPGQRLGLLVVDISKARLALDAFDGDFEDELMFDCSQRILGAITNELPTMGATRDVSSSASLFMTGGLRGEFVIATLDNDDLQHLQRMARRIIAAFSVPMPIAGDRLLNLEVCIGITRLGLVGVLASSLLSSARLAARVARERGSGQYAFFQPQHRRKTRESLNMRALLPSVISRGDLELFYQPKVVLASGEFVGVEALVRARDLQGDFVNSQVFIEAAEQSGMMETIGEAILQMAIDQCKYWYDLGFEIPVSINVSALQFARAGFSHDAIDRISRAKLPPNLIEIELTETAATANAEAAGTRIAILRAAGIRVAIDDFGVGYASVAQFARFDFDTLKFDRSLVELIGAGKRGETLLIGLLAMAATVGHEVVAEGVETQEQRAFLLRHGCPIAQGYLFARPMPPDQCAAWFKSALLLNSPL